MTEMACVELVELVTEYLEGALSPGERERIVHHLSGCEGCRAHLEQVRTVVTAARGQRPEALSDAAEQQLLAAFRAWADGR